MLADAATLQRRCERQYVCEGPAWHLASSMDCGDFRTLSVMNRYFSQLTLCRFGDVARVARGALCIETKNLDAHEMCCNKLNQNRTLQK